MRSFGCTLACGLVFSAVVSAQSVSSSASGIDIQSIDPAVNPCDNFYQYACGNWIKANPVPPQYSRWGRFNELADHNQQVLREILEDSVAHTKRSAVDQKIGTFYGSCMDETAIDKAGYTPIKPALDRIRSLKSKADLSVEVARLHAQFIDGFFRFNSMPDPDNARMTIADVDQGGLGLPDKSYYIDEKDAEKREKYVALVSHMFQLIDVAPAEADAKAKAVLAIETALAKASLDRTTRRNPKLLRNHMTLAQLEELTPAFDFKRYFADRHAPAFDSLNVSVSKISSRKL